tara:strand:+ start:65 stop:649 length:585 start_codon:yes stop_codon:yes gene_type:complete
MSKKYQIIYADPPWQFKNYSDKWHEESKESRWVAKHYNIQTTADICSLDIKSITDKNAVLLLWVTFPRLEDAFLVIKSWGFKYKTCAFNWIKRNKKADSLFWGMGYYTRSNSELCLLATRGKTLKRLSRSVHQILEDRVTEHSRKPDEARKRIIELFGGLPRIELFARERTEGWDVWGNEVKSDIDLIGDQSNG